MNRYARLLRRHSGARVKRANPESMKPLECGEKWIPGLHRAAHPGMTEAWIASRSLSSDAIRATRWLAMTDCPMPLAQFPHMDIDVEVYPCHAALPRLVRASLIPRTGTGNGVTNRGQSQTSPLRQLARAFSGELPRQNNLFAGLVDTYDMWAQLAVPTFIAADHLLLPQNGIANQIIGGASIWHRTCAFGEGGWSEAKTTCCDREGLRCAQPIRGG